MHEVSFLGQEYASFVDRCNCENGLRANKVKVAQFIEKPWKFNIINGKPCMKIFHRLWRETFEVTLAEHSTKQKATGFSFYEKEFLLSDLNLEDSGVE